MFKQIIDREIIKIKKEFSTTSSYIYLTDILKNKKIDKSYRTFFLAEVSWWIYQEGLAREANQFFDTNTEQIKTIFSNLDLEYIFNSRFPIAIFYEVVESAVKFRINFLLKPRDTIVSFIFKKEKHKQFDEINRLLLYFSDYQYLINALKEEIIKSEEKSFSIFKFQELVESIDNEYTSNLNVHTFCDTILPFFELYNINGNELDRVEVPVDFIDIFLYDKKLIPLLNNFKDFCNKESINTISCNTFKNYLGENF